MPDKRIEYTRVGSWSWRRVDGKEGMESEEATLEKISMEQIGLFSSGGWDRTESTSQYQGNDMAGGKENE